MRHGPPTVRQAGGCLGSRPALVREMSKGRRQESAKGGPGCPPTALLARQPLRRHQYEIPRNNRNRPGAWWETGENHPGRQGQPAAMLCLIRSASCKECRTTFHILPPQPRPRAYYNHEPLRTRKLLAHRREIAAAASPSTEGAHLDPAHHLHPRDRGSSSPPGLAKGRKSCTTSAQDEPPQGCRPGSCAQPWPGFSPPAPGIRFSHTSRGRGGGAWMSALTRCLNEKPGDRAAATRLEASRWMRPWISGALCRLSGKWVITAWGKSGIVGRKNRPPPFSSIRADGALLNPPRCPAR